MSKGRTPARISKGEKFEQLVKQVESITMAVRLNQMMVQNLTRQMNDIVGTLATNTGALNDFQYRLLAAQDLLKVDTSALQSVADQLKLADFNKESAKKDLDEKLVEAEAVESDDDVVVIMSTTPDEPEDKGILRSRIKISDMNQPDLQAKLKGVRVGAKVETVLGGIKHVVEVLGVRRAVTQPS